MTLYKDLVDAPPLPALAGADAFRAKYPAFATYPAEVTDVLFETYAALHKTPAKLSLAFNVAKAALVAFGKDDGQGYKVNVMSLKLFSQHLRQIMNDDLK